MYSWDASRPCETGVIKSSHQADVSVMARVTSREKPGQFITSERAASRPRSRPAGNWRGIIRTLSAPRVPSRFALLADGCISQEKGKYSFSQEQNGTPAWQLSLQINHFSTARVTAGLHRVVRRLNGRDDYWREDLLVFWVRRVWHELLSWISLVTK